MLFGSSRFPLTVNPTTLPEGVAESMHLSINPQAEEAKKQYLIYEKARTGLIEDLREEILGEE